MYGFVNGAWRNGHTTTLEFIYDESGRPVQLIWNDGHSAYQQVFNYVLNLQGDVVQLRQASDGAVVATYLYNAWGEILSSSGWMAGHNPLRYRGKYYDNALGMYYLQSRYYDPAIGRFINGDGLISTGQGILGYNMFAFCLNNPVMLSDHTGFWGCSSLLTISPAQMTPTQRQQRNQAVVASINRNRRRIARNNITAGRQVQSMSSTVPGEDLTIRTSIIHSQQNRDITLNAFSYSIAHGEQITITNVSFGFGVLGSGQQRDNAGLRFSKSNLQLPYMEDAAFSSVGIWVTVDFVSGGTPGRAIVINQVHNSHFIVNNRDASRGSVDVYGTLFDWMMDDLGLKAKNRGSGGR